LPLPVAGGSSCSRRGGGASRWWATIRLQRTRWKGERGGITAQSFDGTKLQWHISKKSGSFDVNKPIIRYMYKPEQILLMK
jgi:hypothetical protein